MVGFAMACSLGKLLLQTQVLHIAGTYIKLFFLFILLISNCILTYAGKSDYLKNKKILLLESATKPKNLNLDSYSNRVCALSNASKGLLQSLGVWSHIEKARFGPVKKMQVSWNIICIVIIGKTIGIWSYKLSDSKLQ